MPSAGLIRPSRRVARKLFADDDTDAVKSHHISVEQHFNRILEEERCRARLLYNFDVDKGPLEEGGNYDWIAVRGAPGPYIHKPQRNLCPKYPHLNKVPAYVPQSIRKDTITDSSSYSVSTSSQSSETLVRPTVDVSKDVENNTTPAKHRLRQIKLPELMRISKLKRSESTGKRKRLNDSDHTERAAKQTRVAQS